VKGVEKAIAVAAAGYISPFYMRGHSCALLGDGSVRCWGCNYDGQLGNGTSGIMSVPVTVSGLKDAVSIDAAAGHVCALRANGSVWCWGNNDSGQLGCGENGGLKTSPIPVSGLSGAVAVATGFQHSSQSPSPTLRASQPGFLPSPPQESIHPGGRNSLTRKTCLTLSIRQSIQKA